MYVFNENNFNMKSLCLLRERLSMRNGFCNVFLEECLISFKMYGDSKKYTCFVRYGVCKID